MKEFLPLLIGLIWFGYKMYQGAQKKANAQSRRVAPQPKRVEPTPATEPEMSLDDFMKNFFGETRQPEAKTSPIVNYETIEDGYEDVEEFSQDEILESVESDYQGYQTENVEEPEINLHDGKRLNKDPEFLEVDTLEEENILIDFDVRKAVIYDAILNRPYM